MNPDFSKARACVLLLSGAASDGRSLGAAGSMTSECGHPEVVAETPSPGLTCPMLGSGVWRRLQPGLSNEALQKAHGLWIQTWICIQPCLSLGTFPGGSDSKESACNASNPGSILGLGRSPGEENGYLLQYSCLESSVDRGA